MVAGADDEQPGLIAQQAAAALAALVDGSQAETGHASLLMACRRLLDRHPTCGPLWWLAARLLASPEPQFEAMRAADDLDDDPTPAALAADLPHEAQVTVLGWPEVGGETLLRRLDVSSLVVDARGEGGLLLSRLERAGGVAGLVPESGLAAAAAHGDLVLLEAGAFGEGGFCAVPGSWAAAAVARDAGRPVWLVASRGRVLPKPLWEALLDRIAGDEPWNRWDEVVPLHLVDRVVGPGGLETVTDALARADCPPVPELTRRGLTPGSEQPG